MTRINRAPILLSVLLAHVGLLGASCSALDESAGTTTLPLPPGRIEFVHERVSNVRRDGPGKAFVMLGINEPLYLIDARETEGAEQMIALAEKAHDTGRRVYATVHIRGNPSKDVPNDPAAPHPYLVLRLGFIPDPRKDASR
jgi:hypothetical protein